MLYNKKQSDLLRESLIKWKNIINWTGTDRGTGNCALCQEYFVIYYDNYANEIIECNSCPIKQYTGLNECRGTPYNFMNIIPEDELEFLQMLLEKTIIFRDLT